jgi:hypothetical protein
MDQSTLRLPDPDPVEAPAPVPSPSLVPEERRRRVRQKLYSPVYASFNGPKAGMVVDLSELLDLHEEGFAVQTGEMLEVNRPVALTLDLPETRKFIHGSGQVIWSDPSGRGGIRFSALPESSQRVLQEWLFANLLIASSNHAARAEQLSSRDLEKTEEISHEPLPSAESGGPAPAPDLNDVLSAVDAVRREVGEAGADRDTVFHLIAAHALRLTGASGAALAFLTDGEPAPPLGASVDVKQGLSGECVRSGLIVACSDTEDDSRVDREICRALGIGSILAAPIVADFQVVGLLEVFSPHPHTFTKAHETVLDRLVETIPNEQPEPPLRQDAATGELLPPSSETETSVREVRDAFWEPEPETETGAETDTDAETVPEAFYRLVRIPSRRLYLGIMALVVAIVATAVGYLLAPAIKRHWSGNAVQATTQPVAAIPSAQNVASRSTDEDSPQAVRKLADAGDADAQWRMGVRYHTGAGVLQDDTQAVQWFLRAAEQGHAGAQGTLGAYYWAGRGVPQDLSRAYFWSALAFAQGDENSKSRLEGLSSQMTRSQVNAARQQAEIWIRQHNATKK